MNYVRKVQYQVKPGKSAEFVKLFQNDVMPILKQQAGFRHELTLTDGAQALGISIWDDRPSADSYHTRSFSEVTRKLTPVIDGAPEVRGYELSATTLSS